MGGNRIVDYNLLDNHMFIYKSTPTTKRSETFSKNILEVAN